MKLSSRTIDKLVGIITGDGGNLITMNILIRSGPQLVEFFNRFCKMPDVYGRGFPGRRDYTKDKLGLFNGAEQLKDVIRGALDPSHLNENSSCADKVKDDFNECLVMDGYELVEKHAVEREVDGVSEKIGKYFEVLELSPSADICMQKLSKLDHVFIREQINKAKDKLSKSDYDGAITNARSLVEAVNEFVSEKLGIDLQGCKGDLLEQYKVLKKALNLDPSNKNISTILKQVLSGLNSLIAGLAGLSNKASDRHSREYKPEKHHAMLAVNASLTYCEFLLATYGCQQARGDE